MRMKNNIMNKHKVDPKYNCEMVEDVIICPYCGFDHTDPLEMVDLDEECQEIKCGDCGKKFNLSISKTIYYSTTCMENEHDFVVDDFHIPDMMSCSRCNESKFTRFDKK